MKTLISDVTLVYPGHLLHKKKISVLTDGQSVLKINPGKQSGVHHLNAKGMFLFPAALDAQCHSGEPGFEDKEDLESLTLAAKHGGFSDLFILPSTNPVTDNKGAVAFIRKASGHNGVTLHPLGSVSKELKGKDLSEMYDMHSAGALAFTDAKHPINDVNLMKRALYYVRSFDGMVMSFPNDERLAPGGMVNESPANTMLGLKSAPALAEELMLNRDLYLLAYAQSKLHIATISSVGSVELIKQAKKKGLNLSCGVAMANLLFDESSLMQFDTNFKTNPPLRSKHDKKALIKAVNSGVIDIIVSDHTPEVVENKDIEFDQAHHGMTMLDTMLAAYNTYLSKEIPFEVFVKAISINPRNRFSLDLPKLEEKAAFNFTLFDPKQKWIYDATTAKSKARNNPFFRKELTGKVVVL